MIPGCPLLIFSCTLGNIFLTQKEMPLAIIYFLCGLKNTSHLGPYQITLMINRRILHILIFFISFFTVSNLYSQETTSEIQGIITDANNAPLSGATIVAIHQPTASQYTTTSRKDGHFNLANLRVGGPYSITISYVGFEDKKFDSVSLLLGQTFVANASLSSASQSLTDVIVTTARPNRVINSNRTGAQEIVNRAQIERLPTINRSLQDFTKLEPTANGLSFGGRSSQYNNVTVDGANFNNSFGLQPTLGGQTGSQPISLDAIEQIQVNLSPYDVRQGGFTGAGINTVTRSGTNQFQGSVYTYIKNENYQGYKVGNIEVPKTPIDFNLRGARLGGPIIKNKLFFFISGEQVRQKLPATSYIASDANHPITSGSVSIANADTLNALSSFLQSQFGYDAGPYQGYNLETQSDKVTAKIDWNISKEHTLTLKYNYLKSFADQPASTSRNGFAGFITGGQPGNFSLPFQNSGYVINNNFNIVIAELNSRFGNKANNKFQVGYTALRDYRSSKGTPFPFVDILNNGNIYTSFGYEPFTYNNKLNSNVFQISDIATLYKGGHEITLGTQNYFRKYLNGFAPAYEGIYQFNSLTDFYNSVNSDSLATRYAVQSSALKDSSFPYAEAGVNELSLFAQDKWRINKQFTLTYGIRFDYSTYTGSFDQNPAFAALQFANGAKYDVGRKPKAALLFSPRVGFNWNPLTDQSLQVRGGLGIFSGPPPFVWISNQASNNGVQFSQQVLNNSVPFSSTPGAYQTSGGTNTSYAINVTSNDFKYPNVLKGSLAADKRVTGNWIFTLEGSYSKDLNAVYYSNINLNEDPADAIVLGLPIPRLRYGAVSGTSNKIYSGAGGASAANPNITSGILMDNTNKGYAYAATFRVQKTIKDLLLSVAYTHSEAKNTADFGSTAGGLWSGRAIQDDPNQPNLAYPSWYQPNRVTAFASYRVSYAKYLATSFGLYFEAAPAGVTSYVYNGDINNDANNGNDLIYIPKSASDIVLVKTGSGGLGTGTGTATNPVTDPRSPAQMWAQLNNFISQDRYLSAHRGEVAKANAVVLPYFKRLDANVTQDFSIKTGEDRHTIRLSLDVLNVGNLLSKQWGLVKTPVSTNFLRYEGLGADGKTPSFSFTYQDAGNQIPITNSFSNSTSINSRWQMQLGIRYLFN